MAKIVNQFGSFIIVPEKLVSGYPDLGFSGAGVYGVIWKYCQMSRSHRCFASLETIGADLGFSYNTVAKYIALLEQHGFIRDLTPTRKNHTHIYETTNKLTLLIHLEMVEGPAEAGPDPEDPELQAELAEQEADWELGQDCGDHLPVAPAPSQEEEAAPQSLKSAPQNLNPVPQNLGMIKTNTKTNIKRESALPAHAPQTAESHSRTEGNQEPVYEDLQEGRGRGTRSRNGGGRVSWSTGEPSGARPPRLYRGIPVGALLALADVFQQEAGIVSRPSWGGELNKHWFAPLAEIYGESGNNIKLATYAVREAVQKMSKDKLTIATPQSIQRNAISALAEARREGDL